MNIPRRLARTLGRRLGSELKEIRLFGSRARRTAGPASDYDIVVVLAHKRPEIVDIVYDEALRLELRYGADISFKIYGEEDFERKKRLGTPFMREIQESGIPL